MCLVSFPVWACSRLLQLLFPNMLTMDDLGMEAAKMRLISMASRFSLVLSDLGLNLEESRKRYRAVGFDGELIREMDAVENEEGKQGVVWTVFSKEHTNDRDARLRINLGVLSQAKMIEQPANLWKRRG